MFKKLASIFQKISLFIGILIIILFFVPMMFGIMPYIVMSGSMEPKIKTGSIAYINSHVKAKDIVEGDVIGFNTQEGQVTHRVVKINSDGSFITKGDNNEENDEAPVSVDKVKGKNVFSIPVLGRIIAFIKSKQGIVIICVYVFLNLLCIIWDKKIYEQDIPSSFKEAIMKCDSLDEIKKVIIEEMDSFKEQILEDVSTVDLKKLAEPKQKLLQSGEVNNNDIENENMEKIQDLINKEENFEINEPEEKTEDRELEILLNRIELFDEEEIDLDKVKQELVRYDNPKLRELRDNIRKQIEKSKIVEVDFSRNNVEKNNANSDKTENSNITENISNEKI